MAEDILTKLGIKVTKQRKTIIGILEKAHGPITADEIYDLVEDKGTINYSTVYRTLNTLSEKGVLTRTGEPGGKIYFQLKTHHHGHDIECISCHKHVTVDECPVEVFSRMLKKETGFIVTEHNLEIKGICPDCAKGKS